MPKDEYDEDDPFELVAVSLPGGDAEYRVECFVDEFIRMGYDDARLHQLFVNPLYSATHAIYREKGEQDIQDVIDRIRAKWGGFRFNPSEEAVSDQQSAFSNCSLSVTDHGTTLIQIEAVFNDQQPAFSPDRG